MGEVKLFRLSGSAAVIDLRTGNNATLRPGLVVLSEDAHTHAIATLEAENAKLRAEMERRAPEVTKELAALAWQRAYAEGDDSGVDMSLRMARQVAALLRAPSAPKADPVKVQLLEALEFAARSLATMTSADGSGHADVALCVLRMAGYDDDERERMVDGWKQGTQWRTDAIAAARKGEGE